MSQSTCCACDSGGTTLLFACSGASNVGQIANHAALALDRDGLGSMSCIAAVGAHLSGFVVSARDCDRLVVIDGCEHRCALKTFEQESITPTVHVTLTEQGFEKSHDDPASEDEIARARNLVGEKIEEARCSTNS